MTRRQRRRGGGFNGVFLEPGSLVALVCSVLAALVLVGGLMYTIGLVNASTKEVPLPCPNKQQVDISILSQPYNLVDVNTKGWLDYMANQCGYQGAPDPSYIPGPSPTKGPFIPPTPAPTAPPPPGSTP